MEGRIERLVPGGLGLLRDEGGVVLIRGGLPGELVRARVTRTRGGARQAVVLHVLDRSPDRVAPDCGLHPRCGGCDLLDLAEASQGAAKREMVLDALRRIARLSADELERVAPIERAPRFARARRRAKLTVGAEGDLGFFARDSHDVVPLADGCPALERALDDAARELTEELELPPRATLQLACDDDGRVSLAVGGGASKAELRGVARAAFERGIVTGALVVGRRGQVMEALGDPILQGEIAPGVEGGPYRSDAATFTQATRFGGQRILEHALEGLALEGEKVLELFAGAGHLTLAMAARGAEVVAVEGDARAFHWLERNAAESPFGDRVRPRRGFIEGGSLHGLLEGETGFDALVVDPPRTGVPGLAAILEAVRVARLVMVSCDLATGARDLRIALDHGFVLERLVPIDAFPRTSHVEWVAQLTRSEPVFISRDEDGRPLVDVTRAR